MNRVISSSSVQTLENGKFKKHVEEQEMVNGKRVNYIHYDVHNDKNYLITKGKKNNKTFRYKKKIVPRPLSFSVIWGMPISKRKSKKKRKGSQKKNNKWMMNMYIKNKN